MLRRSLFALIAVIVTAVGAAPAALAVEYEYWSYWHVADGAWQFSGIGPASIHPKDGSVEGWRFAVSGVDGHIAPEIDAASAFETVCADAATPPEDAKRVALVVDTGTDVTSSCVVINADATGYEVLTSAHELRTQKGFVCAIGGVPETGCGDVVDEPSTPSMKPTPSPRPSPSTKPSSSPDPTNPDSPTDSDTPTNAVSPTPTQSTPAATTPSPSQVAASAASEPESSFPWLPTLLVVGIIVIVGIVLGVRKR